ncbi:hypothetical protein OG216_16710 [Streptomycetaceae bacterium NBC_01309]
MTLQDDLLMPFVGQAFTLANNVAGLGLSTMKSLDELATRTFLQPDDRDRAIQAINQAVLRRDIELENNIQL